MKKYWQSNDEDAETFWEHEWATHGTCINTIEPSCYSNYKKGDEAVDFFGKVVSLFKTLDTYSVRFPFFISGKEQKNGY
jgi:ribonuclease T2